MAPWLLSLTLLIGTGNKWNTLTDTQGFSLLVKCDSADGGIPVFPAIELFYTQPKTTLYVAHYL